MQITNELVTYIAELSKLELNSNAKNKMKTELEAIVQYMEILNKLDTDGVEPLSHITDITNVLREDEVEPSFPREKILKNADSSTEEYFVVPKAVE